MSSVWTLTDTRLCKIQWYPAWHYTRFERVGTIDEIVISNLTWKGGTTSELRGWDHFSLPAPKGLVCVKPVMSYGYFTLIQLEQGAWDFSTGLRPTKTPVEKCGIILGRQNEVPANRFIVLACVNPDWRPPRNQASSSSTFLSNRQTEAVCLWVWWWLPCIQHDVT